MQRNSVLPHHVRRTGVPDRRGETQATVGAHTWESRKLLEGVYCELGEPAHAEPLVQERLSVVRRLRAESRMGDEDADVVAVIRDQGEIYRRMGETDKARECFLRVVAFYRRKWGKSGPNDQLPQALEQLGILYLETGDFDLAESLFKEQVEKTRQAYRDVTPAVCLGLSNLAYLYQKTERESQAEGCHTEAASVLRPLLGPRIDEWVHQLQTEIDYDRCCGQPTAASIKAAFLGTLSSSDETDDRIRNREGGEAATLRLDGIMEPFVAGDYAQALAACEQTRRGPGALLELELLRLICLQRLYQRGSAEEVTSRLLHSLAELPFEQALVKLLVGRATPEEVLVMPTSLRERCQTLFYSAAQLRTTGDLDSAREIWKRCAAIDAKCLERAFARAKLDQVGAPRVVAEWTPPWKVGDTIAKTFTVQHVNTEGAGRSVLRLRTGRTGTIGRLVEQSCIVNARPRQTGASPRLLAAGG